MSITWTSIVDEIPMASYSRILALDRRTGFIAVAWYEEIDETTGGWFLHEDKGETLFQFTHWAKITLPVAL